ncbi:MAG: amidohydrolase family protein [Planctomycetota bacterium]
MCTTSRTSFHERLAALVILSAVLISAACATHRPIDDRLDDLAICGGLVLDGTGAEPVAADVFIRDGRIRRVEPRSAGAMHRSANAREVVDATDLVVAPGFVDLHAHGDPLRTPQFRNFLAMGVTTICLGLDGSSPWRDDPQSWFRAIEQRRPGVNVVGLVGHGSVRRAVMGDADRPATAAERDAMAEMVATAMDHGAFGLSTGLEYTPGRFADAEELAAIGEPVGARGGVVASHVRNEDDDAIEASVRELLEQCRRSGAHAHLSHAKIVFAKDAERAAAILDLLRAARTSGVRTTLDVYPYTASYTGISILFPPWALPPNDYVAVAGSRRDDLLAHLQARVNARNGPDATLFGSGPHAGRTLTEAARESGLEPAEVLVQLGPDGASAAYFVMADEVMREFLADPHAAVASDGSPTMRHPRGHGTFPRVLGPLVRDARVLTLTEAVRRMTSLPATILGVSDRGRIAPGMVADVVVFDPKTIQDRATFTEPFRLAEGVRDVLLSGEPAMRDGVVQEQRYGRVLAARRSNIRSPAENLRP